MTTFCSCLHSADEHGFNGCRTPRRAGDGSPERCTCRRSRQRVDEGPDHLKDAAALAAARAKRRSSPS